MDNSILVWFNQASNSSIKHTSDTLKDGKHLLQFAQSKLPNTDSSTVVQSTSTFNNNNFDKLRFIIQQFLTHPSILDEVKEPLSHQLKHLNTDHYLDYLEILLCCLCQHTDWRIRENSVQLILSLPNMKDQKLLMEVIEKRLSNTQTDLIEKQEEEEDEKDNEEEEKQFKTTLVHSPTFQPLRTRNPNYNNMTTPLSKKKASRCNNSNYNNNFSVSSSLSTTKKRQRQNTHKKLIDQHTNKIATLESEIHHLNYLARQKRDTAVDMATKLDISHNTILKLSKDNKSKSLDHQKYLSVRDKLELMYDEKKEFNKLKTELIKQIHNCKLVIEKRTSDVATKEMKLRTSTYDNDRLNMLNENKKHRIKVLEMSLKRREETHGKEIFDLKKRIDELEGIVAQEKEKVHQSPELHLSPRHHIHLQSSSSRSSSASPFSFPSFSHSPVPIHNLYDEIKRSNNMNVHLVDVNTEQINEKKNQYINQMNMMQEDYASLHNRNNANITNYMLEIKEQKFVHRQSIRILQKEYGELQLIVAKDTQDVIISLRNEHQEVVNELIETFQLKCDDLSEQRDEYAEEADMWRRRAHSKSKSKKR